MYTIQQLLAIQHAGGVLEDPSMDVVALALETDPRDADSVELMRLSQALVAAKREFNEAVLRLSIKHKTEASHLGAAAHSSGS